MKPKEHTLPPDHEIVNQLKGQGDLIEDIKRSLNGIGTQGIVESLCNAAHDVKHELMKSIRKDFPSDTDWHVNKLMAIIDTIAFLHTTKCMIDERDTLSKCLS